MNSQEMLQAIKDHVAAIAANGDYGKVVSALKACANSLESARGSQSTAAEAVAAEPEIVADVLAFASPHPLPCWPR